MSNTDPLIAQYEQWMYPAPIASLDAYEKGGGHDYSDPARMRRKLWPRKIEPDSLSILVAGCGANQAAIIAHSNPDSEVVGIDLSQAAIDHHQKLKKQHGLKNLRIEKLAIQHADDLGQEFDLIISTGVIHHLQTPATGLAALARLLPPHGVISLMLYGRHRRTGITMVQEALAAMGAARDANGLALAKAAMESLPAWHSAHPYIESAPDMGYDAGIVDTLLNARERAYSVPEIMALLDATGLRFHSWLDGLNYSPSAVFPPDSPIHDQVADLEDEQVWNIVDLLTQTVGAHRFIACRADRPDSDTQVDFSGYPYGDWLNCIPHKHPQLAVTHELGGATLRRDWHSVSLHGASVAAIIDRIDGKATVSGLLQSIDASDREHAAAVLIQLAEWDHIYFELNRPHSPS